MECSLQTPVLDSVAEFFSSAAHKRHVLLLAETAAQYEARIAVLHSQQAELRKSGGQNTVGAKLSFL